MADNLLDKASILLTPTAYDNGSMLSIKPNENLYGSEEVTNGDFDGNASGWNLQVGWAYNGNKVSKSLNNSSYLLQTSALTIGKKYKVTFTISDYVSGEIGLNSVFWGTNNLYSTNGTYEVTAITTSANFYLYSNASFVGSIDNVSVKEDLSGDFNFERNSAATRVNAQGLVENVQILSSNLVTNGDFATDSDWTLGTGWTISSGLLNASSVSSNCFQSSSFILGKTYKVTYSISNYVSGLFRVTIGSDGFGQNRSSNGTFTENIVYSGANFLYLRGTSSFVGSIDNISVKEITDDTNLPRIDYTDGCGVWLLEPQSTNLYLNSETLSTQSNTTSASTYTVSFYGTGTITFSGTHTGTLVGTAADERVSATFTTTSGTLTSTVSGTCTKGQLENLSYATSYIPTNGAANTRLQDIANNSGNSSLINSTEGVFYAEIAALANDGTKREISINNGTTTDRVQILLNPASNELAIFYKAQNGATQFTLSETLTDITQFNKIAFKWKANDFALWINGTETDTISSGVTSNANALTKIDFDQFNGGAKFYGKTKALAVYKEALTDAELQSLTTQ
jgi:hypothetical protein